MANYCITLKYNWWQIMIKGLLFLITTFVGYFLGKWISVSLNTLFPIYFSVDPNFIQKVFSSKPTITNEIVGYVIYSVTALIMFSISNLLDILVNENSKIKSLDK